MSPHRIRSQAGTSLADTYDVEGSIAGLEELDSSDVKTVHELGGTIFSERYGQVVIELTPGAIAQSIVWNINLSLGRNVSRVLGHFVVTDLAGAGRVQRAQLSVASVSEAGVIFTDVPFWVWDLGIGNDVEKAIRMLIEGVSARVNSLQVGEPIGHPLMGSGPDQSDVANQLVFRGEATAFGAGTVTPRAFFMIGRTSVGGGLSSRGLPVPSW